MSSFSVVSAYLLLFLLLSPMFGKVESISVPRFLPNVQIVKHDELSARRYLHSLRDAPFNHEHAGNSKSSDEAPCAGFLDLRRDVRIGSGREDFLKASKLVLSFAMVNKLGWAQLISARGSSSGGGGASSAPSCREGGDSSSDNNLVATTTITKTTTRTSSKPQVGDVIGTLVNCYKVVWALNPCRVTSVREESNICEVAFSTLSGHLIAGEERFRVTYADDEDGAVMFSMYSFTKGATSGPGVLGLCSGVVGRMAMPCIRPLQRRFFRGQEKAMVDLMAATAAAAQ
jgi:uncharacterized protein (UPF0548 family)